MQFIKLWSFLLAVIIGFVTLLISLGALGMMSPALAQEPEPEVDVPAAQMPGKLQIIVVFTGPDRIPILDLATGDPIGEGTHEGKVQCKNKCSQKIQLQLNGIEYLYQFKTRLAADPTARRLVAGGEGTIRSKGKKERFSFTAAFQDNGDGTIEVTYNASRPDASFFVPGSPGELKFSGE